MTGFMEKDFLLNTETARKLFRTVENLPIIDYHCHISPREIYDDRQFENIAQIWLGADHYKWRLMRCAGVEEKYITGDASDHDKFIHWAEVLGKSIGNPLYHWSHLELQRYFDINIPLNSTTAEDIWNAANDLLKSPEFSVRNLIRKSRVETICTTDDPVDSLEWHEKLREDSSFHTAVLPAWRPDRAMNPIKKGYPEYIQMLENVSGITISSFNTFTEALLKRMDYFEARNCRLSDHGLDYICWEHTNPERLNDILQKGIHGESITTLENDQFKTACLIFLAKEYKRRDWVMQIHYGCLRNVNPVMTEKLGPDSGFDMIGDSGPTEKLASLMGTLEKIGALPKTILYSLDSCDNQTIDTLCGCFQNSESVCKIQHGSAWWFNDSIKGMTEQLENYANLGYLAGFIGMLTDSRSFLSYPRHEYFRRILCRILGQWIEEGMYPYDLETVGNIVQDISYYNAKEYFGFVNNTSACD